MKVYLESAGPGRHATILDVDMLRGKVQLVGKPSAADVCIYATRGPGPKFQGRTIMTYCEPPLGEGYLEPHQHPDRFRHVYTYRPHHPNQSPITELAIAYPYSPRVELDRPPRTELSPRRRVFYAGTRESGWMDQEDCCYRRNLYRARTALVDDLRRLGTDVVAHGPGWGSVDNRRHGDFQAMKVKEIDECDADFVLCMENSSLEHYISEKIHSGWHSGRVTLYLGSPTAAQLVPKECYVDLLPYYDISRHRVDAQAVRDIIMGMTPEQYRSMTAAAAEWRRESRPQERYLEQKRLLTTKIMRRIGCQ